MVWLDYNLIRNSDPNRRWNSAESAPYQRRFNTSECSLAIPSTHFSLPALKKSISPWVSKMMPAVATKLAPEAEATTNAGPDLWKATFCPHNHLFRLTPHGGWWGIKLATTTQAKPGWHVGVEFVMRTSPRHEINHVEAERQTQIVGLQALDSGTGWPESIDGDDFFMRAGVWEQQSIDISQLIFFTMRMKATESKSSPLATLPMDWGTQVITRFESSFPLPSFSRITSSSFSVIQLLINLPSRRLRVVPYSDRLTIVTSSNIHYKPRAVTLHYICRLIANTYRPLNSKWS